MIDTYKNNGVIAEFMGAVWKQDDYGDWGYYCGNFPHYNHMQPKGALQYHSHWEWLMPVIEKISKIPCADLEDTCYPITFNMPRDDGKVMFRFKGFSLHAGTTLIEAAYNAVVEFVEFIT